MGYYLHYQDGYAEAVAEAHRTGDWSEIAPVRGDRWQVGKGKYKGREFVVDKTTYSGKAVGQIAPTLPGEFHWRDATLSLDSLNAGVRLVDGHATERAARAAREAEHRRVSLKYISDRALARRKALARIRPLLVALIDGDRVASAARLRAVADLICTYERPREVRAYHHSPMIDRATLYRVAYHLDGDGVLYHADGTRYRRLRPATPWVPRSRRENDPQQEA